MKTVYVCEICGASYDTYEACQKCEDMHKSFTDDLDEILKPLFTYSAGRAFPETAVLAIDLGEYDFSKHDKIHDYRLAKYEFAGMVPEKEAACLLEKYEIAENERKIRIEKYLKEKEEGKERQ